MTPRMTDTIQNGEGVGARAREVAWKLIIGEKVGGGDGQTYTCRTPTVREVETALLTFAANEARHSLAREPATADVEREALEARDTAQSAVEAWAEVFEGLEAHLQDRIAMQDEGSPAMYLSIIRSSVANVLRASVQIRAARWADYNRQSWRVAELEAQIAALSRAAPSSEPAIAEGERMPKGFVLTESEADDDCGCPEEMWDTPYGALHMHLSAGKPSNACLDDGDAGEWEITLTADTVDDARRAFFGWASFVAYTPVAALAQSSTPPASKPDDDPDGWLAVKVNSEGGIVMPYGPLHPHPDRPNDPRYRWAPFYLGEPQ